MEMCQGIEDSALTCPGGNVAYLGKELLGLSISHGDAVWHIRKHGKIIVAVAKGIGLGNFHLIMI